ncbi:hypothetical protein Lal_00026669 [Lupinus albus]|nr:hypothetical protein Lal_00026669 [Lupinus albus]
MVQHVFEFPHELEAQGVNFKYGAYISLVKGKVFTLDEDMFLQGESTKVRSFSVENRLINYVITYILVLRNTNHAQPTINDLKFVCNQRRYNGNSQGHVLYRLIFLEVTCLWNFHLTGYRSFGNRYFYCGDDHNTTVDLELTDEEEDVNQAEQHPKQPPAEAYNMPQEPSFGLAHLDAMEQRMTERIDSGFQSLNHRIHSGLASLYGRVSFEVQRHEEMTREKIEQIIFIIRTIGRITSSPPPPPTE